MTFFTEEYISTVPIKQLNSELKKQKISSAQIKKIKKIRRKIKNNNNTINSRQKKKQTIPLPIQKESITETEIEPYDYLIGYLYY